MVTITTTAPEEKEKTSNCVTPKKKAGNSAAASTDTTEQTAPNILVYKKVRELSTEDGISFDLQNISDGSDCRSNAIGERWSVR